MQLLPYLHLGLHKCIFICKYSNISSKLQKIKTFLRCGNSGIFTIFALNKLFIDE